MMINQVQKEFEKKKVHTNKTNEELLSIISDIDSNDFESAVNEMEHIVEDYAGLLDMKVTFNVDLGNAKITLREFLKMGKGFIIDLNKAAGESAEVYVNNRIIGRGELMVYEKNLAIRVNEILSSDAVLYYFTNESHRV
jgi:flagellar motor switch protein FliN/FliY